MRRNRLLLLLILVPIALILVWLAVAEVHSRDLSQLNAAFRSDVERWGRPEEIEWIRPPVFGAEIPGTAADCYAQARNALIADWGSISRGLLGQWSTLQGLSACWEDPDSDPKEEFGYKTEGAAIALEFIGRGARTGRSGRASSLADAILGNGARWDKWAGDILEIGNADVLIRVRAGDPRGAVDRALALHRFARDLQRTGAALGWRGRRALRSIARLLKHGDLATVEEARILQYLRRELADPESIPEVVRQAGLRTQRVYAGVTGGSGPSPMIIRGQLNQRLADWMGIDLLPQEIAGAWRRSRAEFRRFDRIVANGDVRRLREELREWGETVECGRGPAERALFFHGVCGAAARMENAIDERLEMEAILLGLSLRREWRRTGRCPVSTDEFCPPEVRTQPLGRPWILRPEPGGGGVRLRWTGEYGPEFRIRPPRLIPPK